MGWSSTFPGGGGGGLLGNPHIEMPKQFRFRNDTVDG